MNLLQIESFYHRLIKELKLLVGDHREFTPMYPNFPGQVMDASECELYWNAIRHYITLKLPEFEKEDRPELDEAMPYRVIDLGTREEFDSIFTQLSRSNSPWSTQDQEDVKWYVSQYGNQIQKLLPEKIPSKENLAFLGAQLIRSAPETMPFLDSQIQTATDVLRLAVALSEGDVSLAKPCRFGKFRRKERAMLLGWIERTKNPTEDMLRWKPRWIRLGEKLHPGEYSIRFPLAASAFAVLRNNQPFQTFNSQIETGLVKKNTNQVLKLLDSRPGEFARRLDHLLRISAEKSQVIEQWKHCAKRVSTPVLLQVMTHFQLRQQLKKLRVFFPKSDVANLYATRKSLPAITRELSDAIVLNTREALIERFAQLTPLGKCYLDPKLKNYLVPFSQRSASKSLRTLVRGSKSPFPDCQVLRFFVWWKNGKSRVDIDLSAVMYDTDYQYIDTLAYYNLKNFGAYHSGDITDAPNGAAEFIDVNLSLCLDKKVRYIVMILNSFTQQPYCDLPECFAGWMVRSQPNSGEIFEPKTLLDKVDIASDTRCCLPAVFDLEDHSMVWMDIGLQTIPRLANNVRNNLGGVSLMLQAMTQLKKTNLYDLFELHIQARGETVTNIEDAETIFSIEHGLTPYDLDTISAEYL